MRIRTIKPGFFKDDEMAELDPLTRILFIGLWCLADGEGRLEYRPKLIKAEILPYDDCDIEKMLEALGKQRGSGRCFTKKYEFEGRFFLQIVNFKRHQRISGREAETASIFPNPTESLSTVGNNREATGKQRGSNGEAAVVQEGKGRERKGIKTKDTSPKGVAAKDAAESGEVPFDPEPEKDLPIPHLKVLSPDKSPPPHVQFVESFKKTYEGMTHQPFKADNKHYAMVAKLFKSHGQEAVIKKAEILGRLCEQHKWPANDGWKNFTIERISNQWNAILESSEQTGDQKLIAALQAQEKKDAEHRAYMASR